MSDLNGIVWLVAAAACFPPARPSEEFPARHRCLSTAGSLHTRRSLGLAPLTLRPRINNNHGIVKGFNWFNRDVNQLNQVDESGRVGEENMIGSPHSEMFTVLRWIICL